MDSIVDSVVVEKSVVKGVAKHADVGNWKRPLLLQGVVVVHWPLLNYKAVLPFADSCWRWSGVIVAVDCCNRTD